MAIEQLEYCTAETNVIASLADKPNAQSGMTAAQVKAKFDAADAAIKGYINDTLVPYVNNKLGAMDTKLDEHDEGIDVLETDRHTHGNKELLDSYTQTEENLADAVSKKHEHTNKTSLDTYDKTQTELLQLGCNPNLLDNWYFPNPVNQRGQTSYSANGYTVDRWRLTGAASSATVESGGLTYVGSGNSNISELLPLNLAGQTVTISALVENAANTALRLRKEIWSVLVGVNMSGSGLFTATGTVPADYSDNLRVSICAGSQGESVAHSVKIVAIKLELGAQQTLAHKDTSGNWVLNAIPNYSEELTKCLRYYRRSWTGTVAVNGSVPFVCTAGGNSQPAVHWETPMRTTPTITVRSWGSGGVNHIRDWNSHSDVEITGIAYASPYGFALNGLGSLTAGGTYSFHYEASAEL